MQKTKNSFKQSLKKLILLLILGFFVLFLFRLLYGYSTTNSASNRVSSSSFGQSFSMAKRNYASKSYKVKAAGVTAPAISVDQKYEKIANIKTKSSEFDKEEQQARAEIEKYKALIQFEQKSGNKGRRSLNLIVGVPPENFDDLYNALVIIGNVQARQITKKDKTNEYKELNAKKASLEKIRSSLIALKNKGGKIEEYMKLENRILEIEQKLQDLGVSLGDFDDENEFCTVKFALKEGKKVNIRFIHRIKVALQWTIQYYMLAMMGLFFLSGFAYLLLLIIDKLKVLEKAFK